MINYSFDEEKKSRHLLVKILVPVIAVIVTILIVFFIIKTNNKKSAFGNWGGVPGGVVTSVRTITAENTVLQDYLRTNGEVETQTSMDIFPSIGGKVVSMKVALGSSVRKGDTLAFIDPSEPGAYYVSSPVTAPISGSILSAPVKTGQRVTASTVIAKIGDIENLQITAKVPEKYIAELKIGLKAEIVLEAYPDTVFTVTVSKISPVVDAATRTKDIILTFDKKDSRINAGMFAKVKLFTTEYSDKIAVQQDSLINNSDKYYLFVVNPDGETVTKREVTIGHNVDGYYQILSGIEPGEKIVVEGMLTLAEGSKIKDISKGN